jgi:hypothetical protein
MAIAFHLVNKPQSDVREAYETAWRQLDAQGARHPDGRLSHTAWLIGDVLHVCDVWESQEQFDAFMRSTLGALLEDSGMELAAPPQAGEVLQIVRPD